MDGNLRAGLGAGRLQRTLVMRLLYVASAGALTLVALLLWNAAEPSAQHAPSGGESATVWSGLSQDVGPAVTAARPQANRSAKQAGVRVRHLLLSRARLSDGEGDATPTSALVSSPVQLVGNVADSARARLRRLALGHAPYGEPSPFDATAPPLSTPRNG